MTQPPQAIFYAPRRQGVAFEYDVESELVTGWDSALAPYGGNRSKLALMRATSSSISEVIGMPPIRYLTIWRLQTAKLSLRETRKTIGQLAQEVGYGSGEAFSRAFKREFGLSPARWRDQHPVD